MTMSNLGKFKQMITGRSTEETRYWVAATYKKTPNTEVGRDQIQEMEQRALNLEFQAGRGQVFYDPTDSVTSFKIYYRTTWFLSSDVNTGAPADQVVKMSKDIVDAEGLSQFTYSQSRVYCGTPERVGRL